MDYAEKQYLIGMRTCAEEGDEDALMKLRESFEAAKKAAESGEAAALCDLGEHYLYGFGTRENEAEAVNCYKKAAFAFYDEHDIDEAIFCLRGLPEDDDIHILKRSMRYDDEAKGIVVTKFQQTNEKGVNHVE
jgi:TPR repeat protein